MIFTKIGSCFEDVKGANTMNLAPADTVISLESALLCMEEFFDTLKRPQEL